jgi:hypothetical protein
VHVVLPTPPFWFASEMTLVKADTFRGFVSSEESRSAIGSR